MFGDMVRASRQRLGLTQEELAEVTGLSARSISKIETCRIISPRPATVRLLADAFGLTGAQRDHFCRSAAAEPSGYPGVRTGVPLSPAREAPAVPRQLPTVTGHFVGRAHELGVLDRLAASGHTAVVISAIAGTAGIGKTALALHWAHQMSDRFPDGQLYVDLRGFHPGGMPVDPAEAVRGFLDALGVPPQHLPAGLDAQAARYRSLLAVRRMLIVLDNARDAEQVRPLLPATPTCLVLVTSRNQLTSLAAREDAHQITLDLLAAAESRQLLCGRVGAERVDAEPHAVEQIITGCARLPLALAIVAARAAASPHLPLAALAEQLREVRSRLDALAGEDTAADVRAVFSWSYRQLGIQAARLFRLLSLHPGPDISVPAVASLAGLPPPQTAPLLSELTRAHLLTEPTPDRYTLHDLLRTYAAEQARNVDPEPDRHTATGRLLDHYLHSAVAAVATAYPQERDHLPRVPAPETPTAQTPTPTPTPTPEAPTQQTPTPEPTDPARAARSWLDTELPNLLAAAHHGCPVHTLHLSTVLRRHLYNRGYYREAETLHHRALALARAGGNRAGELNALNSLGQVDRVRGRYEDAIGHYQRALSIAADAGERLGELEALNGLGQIRRLQGRYEQAADHFQRALDIAGTVGCRDGEWYALNGLGHVHGLKGRYQEATDCFRRALDIAGAIADRHGELEALNGLGQVHRAQGRYERAADHYQRALDIAASTGNRTGELYTLYGLGEAHRARGYYGRAAECYQQAVDIARTTGDRYGELYALSGLGDVHLAQERYEQAAHHYRRALGIARRTNHRNGEVEALLGLGNVHHATGHPRTALTHLHQALDLAAELGQPAEQTRACDRLAHAYHALRQYDRARHHWQHALAILTRLGTDRTDDPKTTTSAIRTRLADLEHQVGAG